MPPAFYRAAADPLPTYTQQMAQEAIHPGTWQCSATIYPAQPRTVFSFVHVFKASGTTLRHFFHELAYSCHKTGSASAGIELPSIQSRGKWTPCKIQEVADGRNRRKEAYWDRKDDNFVKSKRRTFRAMSSGLLENDTDIYGGQVRIGTGDHAFPPMGTVRGSVRYIIVLRDPIVRYVSGRLHKDKVRKRDNTLESVVTTIKENVSGMRSNGGYMGKSLDYLLTPEQREETDQIDYAALRPLMSAPSSSNVKAEVGARLAIRNLHHYNALIGFTERMPESLHILKRVFLTAPDEALKEGAEKVFHRYGASGNSTAPEGGVQANKSDKKGLSTSAVVAELEKDAEFMRQFEEYVKYERMIHEYAWEMHAMQFEAAVAAAERR
ncbi:hypothetical protein ACHAXT_000666 [Thalassiosira profunda]